MSLKLSVLFLSLTFIGCASVPDGDASVESYTLLKEGDEVIDVSGWVQERGEIMLYSSPQAMEASFSEVRTFPDCISGTGSREVLNRAKKYSGKLVRLRAVIRAYESLPTNGRLLPSFALINGEILPNYCDGDLVLEVREVWPMH